MDERDTAQVRANIVANQERIGNAFMHARLLADLLASEWVVDGAQTRAWHARYIDAPESRHACVGNVVLMQRRGIEGFSVAIVREGHTDTLHSSLAVSLVSAVIWLGLDHLDYLLDWRHEL